MIVEDSNDATWITGNDERWTHTQGHWLERELKLMLSAVHSLCPFLQAPPLGMKGWDHEELLHDESDVP